jgi:hypothetical protein
MVIILAVPIARKTEFITCVINVTKLFQRCPCPQQPSVPILVIVVLGESEVLSELMFLSLK